MAIPTPEAAAQAWAQRLAGSTDRIQSGVQAVTTPPGQAAARQKNAYANNVAANVDKWAARTAAVPLAEWQTAMVSKGVPRIAQGAQAAQGSFGQFMSQLLPAISANVNALPARGGLEANITRMTAFTRAMAQFKRR